MAAKHPKAKDLRGLPDTDLQEQLAALRQELWQDRVKTSTGALPQVHQLQAARRQIARIHTLLRERQLSTTNAKPSARAAAARP